MPAINASLCRGRLYNSGYYALCNTFTNKKITDLSVSYMVTVPLSCCRLYSEKVKGYYLYVKSKVRCQNNW